MTKTLAFLRLDLLTIKPYLTLKNLIIFLLIAVFISLYTRSSGSVIGIFMAMGALYVSYPFAVGEQNGIDTLYATLTLNRNNVVSGRYVFALFVDVMAGLLAFVASFGVLAVMNIRFDPLEALAVFIGTFLIFSFIQAFQLPIYFKLGYARAKILAYLPFMGVFLFITLMGVFYQGSNLSQLLTAVSEWVAANPFLLAFILIAVWCVIMGLSYRLSLRFYQNRDL